MVVIFDKDSCVTDVIIICDNAKLKNTIFLFFIYRWNHDGICIKNRACIDAVELRKDMWILCCGRIGQDLTHTNIQIPKPTYIVCECFDSKLISISQSDFDHPPAPIFSIFKVAELCGCFITYQIYVITAGVSPYSLAEIGCTCVGTCTCWFKFFALCRSLMPKYMLVPCQQLWQRRIWRASYEWLSLFW